MPPFPSLTPPQVLDENTAAAGGMCANYNSTSNTLLVVRGADGRCLADD